MAFIYTQIMLPSEVVEFASITKEFPLCTIRTIRSVEFNNLLECLGETLYKLIMADLVDYTTTPPAAYNNATAYVVGNIVCFNGLFYTNIFNTVANPPPNTTFWVLSPKFTTACYETLFCQFLGEWLAWLIVQERIPFWFRQFRAEGLVKLMGKSFEAADLKDFHTVQKAVHRNIERSFENVDTYIKLNFENTCFTDYVGLDSSGCCATCGCTSNLCGCDDCSDDYENSGYVYQAG